MTRNTKAASDRPNSIPKAAHDLGVSIPTVYGLIAMGKLRSYKIGRARRVSDDAVRDCIKQLEQESQQVAA